MKDFNPGPPSMSRKKRRQIGAYVAHPPRIGQDPVSGAPVLEPRPKPHPKSRRRATRKRAR